jgi:GT2 family glycosyltransferase
MSETKYSIIIPFYDNKPILEICITKVAETLKNFKHEIIVINDNPFRDKPSLESFNGLPINVLSSNGNRGYSGAINLGAENARGDSLVLLDSDVVVTDNWLPAMIEVQERSDAIGSVAATVLSLSSGLITHYGSSFLGLETLHPYLHRSLSEPLPVVDRPFQCVPAGTLLIDRELFLRMDGLNPTFWNAFADYDLSLRLCQQGLESWVSSSALVYHRGGVSGKIRYSSYADTKTQFFSRWSDSITDDGQQLIAEACRELVSTEKQSNLAGMDYLFANLSSSIHWRKYMELVSTELKIRIADYYSLPDSEKNRSYVRLEERLGWDTNSLGIPILYFVDIFPSIRDNFYWFANRNVPNDLVFDRNGNLLPVSYVMR